MGEIWNFTYNLRKFKSSWNALPENIPMGPSKISQPHCLPHSQTDNIRDVSLDTQIIQKTRFQHLNLRDKLGDRKLELSATLSSPLPFMEQMTSVRNIQFSFGITRVIAPTSTPSACWWPLLYLLHFPHIKAQARSQLTCLTIGTLKWK